MWLLGKTPQWLGLAIARPLGWLLHHAMKSRRRIATRNIERCFPQWPPEKHDALVREHFGAIARMMFETLWSWSISNRRLLRMGRAEGVENVSVHLEKGRGVLAITHHVTCLELGGRLAGYAVPNAAGIYRPLRNPVIEWYQNRGRRKYAVAMFSKRDLRGAIRHLRKGNLLWYAPDQDFGPQRSVFAPLFGIQAATLEATARLIQMTDCAVVPMFPVYDAQTRRYTAKFLPALEDFPSGDIVEDLTRLNAMMEAQIREAPEQYWWIHRRFKTRPEGEPPFYD
jgi:KDO2-lipid IV(A) lauroyltransferase